MNLDSHIVGAVAAVAAYILLLTTYFARTIKKYPKDRGIRFGSVAVIVFLSGMVIFRVPDLSGISHWILPALFVTELVLVPMSLFFLIAESAFDMRKWRRKKHVR